MEKKENKTEFVIMRVTKREKKIIVEESNKYLKDISKYLRKRLGLDLSVHIL